MAQGRKFNPGEAHRQQAERRVRNSARLAAERAVQQRMQVRKPQPPPGRGWTAEERQIAKPGPWENFDSTRVRDARWVGGLNQIQVHFADGTPWVYAGVTYEVWRRLKRSTSPGRFVNRVLSEYEYYRGEGF
jgi:hypothetical protein